jgi:myo-inositol-1(or 4)-monophosphatase
MPPANTTLVMAQNAITVAIIERIARTAGGILLEGWEKRPAVELKGGEHDLVTEYDRRAEAYIVSELSVAFPDDGIVGEEGARRSPVGPTGAPPKRVWYVDPLDGTVNFAHGFPMFAVSIGAHVDGQPVAGVVHAPAVGWTFIGGTGVTAARDGKAIRPSAAARLDRSLVVTGFPSPRTARLENTPSFLAFNQNAEGVRRIGSAALDLCFVACGWLDGSWSRALSPWDMAGGAAVVVAAGGKLTTLEGAAYDPLNPGLVASNGLIHDEMLAVVAGAGR